MAKQVAIRSSEIVLIQFCFVQRGRLATRHHSKATKFRSTMPDEERYPTVRFYTCRSCGQVFTGSLSGQNACTRCNLVVAPSHPKTFFGVETHGSHFCFRIHGGSYRIGDLAELKTALEKAEKKSPASIAFLFDGESVLDSGFLNLMARTVYLQSKAGNTVFVVAQQPHILESLQVVGLDQVISVLPDENAYLAAIPKAP